jgi:methylisocitrate lyase
MSFAASKTYETIRHDGTQSAMLDCMQPRQELYEVLGYLEAEKKVNNSKS